MRALALLFLLMGISACGEDPLGVTADAGDEARRLCASDAYRAVCGAMYDSEPPSQAEQKRREQALDEARKRQQERLKEQTPEPDPPRPVHVP